MSKLNRLTMGIAPALVAGALLGGAGVAASAPATTSATDSADAAAVRESIVRSDEASGVITTTAGGWYRCPSGYMCLYSGYNGTGHMAYFKWGSPNLGGQGIDNTASSQWNRSSGTFTLYDGYNYSGHGETVSSDTYYNFTSWGGDNWYSSLRR